MIHANPLPTQTRFAKDNETLPGRDHLLHVMQVEPAACERLAQRVGARLLQRGFKDFLPSAKSAHGGFDDLAAKANCNVALLARKMGKLMPIFVTAWEMREQIFHPLDAETAQREKFRLRDPIKLLQRLQHS